MRVLVTGATGFVGRSVTMALLGDGHEVHGLVRDPASARGLREAGVSLHAGDMREPGTYVPLVGQVDAVVQAAQLSTAGRVTRAKARAVFAAEHTMTSALAQACLDQHKRLVYTGGCFDWGDHGEELITEQTPLSPSPMGQGHAREAAALQRLHDEQGLDVVRLNPGFVYGPGGLLKTAFIDQARKGRLRCIGPGRNWWSWPLVGSLVTSFRIDATRVRDDLHWRPAHPSFRESGPGEVSALAQDAQGASKAA